MLVASLIIPGLGTILNISCFVHDPCLANGFATLLCQLTWGFGVVLGWV